MRNGQTSLLFLALQGGSLPAGRFPQDLGGRFQEPRATPPGPLTPKSAVLPAMRTLVPALPVHRPLPDGPAALRLRVNAVLTTIPWRPVLMPRALFCGFLNFTSLVFQS